MPFVRAISTPICGYLADTYRNKKTISLVTRSIATIILLLLALPVISNGGFWPIYAVSIGMSVFSGAWVIIDSYALEFLGKNDK